MLTLPYIYSISNLNNKNRNDLLIRIRKNISKANIKRIKEIILKNGGIEYSREKLLYFSKMAENELDNFPTSIYKDSLYKAIKFNIDREY